MNRTIKKVLKLRFSFFIPLLTLRDLAGAPTGHEDDYNVSTHAHHVH